MIPLLAIAAPTLSEFGIYYFVFGLFIVLGFVMLGLILVAEPSPQYDIDSLEDVVESPPSSEK
ncbi:MAG: hypothetical protein M1368_12425 [Thaumarchaeota archaeon]|nr:hypothetical protein [Nitrososphaerota archaeon]MDG6907926.1 hypothetical protein [Nitrososphaerota archaeon]